MMFVASLWNNFASRLPLGPARPQPRGNLFGCAQAVGWVKRFTILVKERRNEKAVPDTEKDRKVRTIAAETSAGHTR